ncbi:MAG: hypothetical protein ACON41_05235 [Parvibaculales bacterium]
MRLFGFLSKKAPAPKAEERAEAEAEAEAEEATEESFADETAETILGLAQASQEHADGTSGPDDALNETLSDFVQAIQSSDALDDGEADNVETEEAAPQAPHPEEAEPEEAEPGKAESEDAKDAEDAELEDTDAEIILDLADDPTDILAEAADVPLTPDALFPEIATQTPPKPGRVKILVWSFLLAITVTLLLGATAFGTYLYALKQAPSARDIAQLDGQGLNVTAVSFEHISNQLGETLLINIDLQNNSATPQKLGKIDIYLTGTEDKILASWQIDTSGQQLAAQERTAITTRLFTIPEGLQNVMAVHHSAARE